jgi:hypothetical protein
MENEMKVTHYVLMPVKRKCLKDSNPWPLFGAVTKDGCFTSLSGQKFNANLAHPVWPDFRQG